VEAGGERDFLTAEKANDNDSEMEEKSLVAALSLPS
jgi:hypothetical protein